VAKRIFIARFHFLFVIAFRIRSPLILLLPAYLNYSYAAKEILSRQSNGYKNAFYIACCKIQVHFIANAADKKQFTSTANTPAFLHAAANRKPCNRTERHPASWR
jgi:hypothetical protein